VGMREIFVFTMPHSEIAAKVLITFLAQVEPYASQLFKHDALRAGSYRLEDTSQISPTGADDLT